MIQAFIAACRAMAQHDGPYEINVGGNIITGTKEDIENLADRLESIPPQE